jgi:hypothetical protein
MELGADRSRSLPGSGGRHRRSVAKLEGTAVEQPIGRAKLIAPPGIERFVLSVATSQGQSLGSQ